MTSPKRRRMNCNITRILSHDARPGTVSLYCSQILSRSKTAEGRSIAAEWRYAYPAYMRRPAQAQRRRAWGAIAPPDF
ncbi:hypothetical protein FNI11_09165 [Salmonella enterica subsp. salamae]|nr:hypothetical protein [Salmonella enterica subsp. salamae]ECJ2281056.1 hypothetical protein [Salmonella enterica subsp. salamae]